MLILLGEKHEHLSFGWLGAHPSDEPFALGFKMTNHLRDLDIILLALGDAVLTIIVIAFHPALWRPLPWFPLSIARWHASQLCLVDYS